MVGAAATCDGTPVDCYHGDQLAEVIVGAMPRPRELTSVEMTAAEKAEDRSTGHGVSIADHEAAGNTSDGQSADEPSETYFAPEGTVSIVVCN